MGILLYSWFYFFLISETVDTVLVNSNLTALPRNAADDIFCDKSVYNKVWLRHPSNCSRYFVCSGGQVTEMESCPNGRVFSVNSKTCVPVNSDSDDCDEMIYSVPLPADRPGGPSLLWHPQLPHSPVSRPGAKAVTINIDEDETEGLMCHRKRSPLLQPHPDNCAWYYNCSMVPDAVMETFYSGFTMECPYPQLFSDETMQCEDFEDVDCRGRYEPKSPCDYRANHCHETSHCIPCWVRYASCTEQEDGLNPWPELEWKPFFVECYQERTVFQGVCEKNAVFSPLTRACETPYSIPRQHGGWRPSCEGRRDNVYADEYGRCDIYYVCKGEMFTGFFRCESDQLFNPITKSCEDPEFVPYPCGNMEMPNICKDRHDGLYLDAFGRCTHYMECRHHALEGVSMCPNGIFNPEKRICDVSGNIVQPCGNKTNPCLYLPDGFHPSSDSSCHSYIQCDRGFLIAKFQCENNLVYNEALQKCDDVGSAPPPCGIAPHCSGKSDGLYPALNKGLQYYYECKDKAFITYRRCRLYEGGLVFSPQTRRCDLPASVCEDMYQAELKKRCS